VIDKLIFAGRYQHDGAGELIYIGDMTSVPALLRVLKDNAPKDCSGERCGYICTYSHALAAREKITGHKAVVYEDWAAWWEEYQKSHPGEISRRVGPS
jgi:NADPH-dependent ferric siderophore reductase